MINTSITLSAKFLLHLHRNHLNPRYHYSSANSQNYILLIFCEQTTLLCIFEMIIHCSLSDFHSFKIPALLAMPTAKLLCSCNCSGNPSRTNYCLIDQMYISSDFPNFDFALNQEWPLISMLRLSILLTLPLLKFLRKRKYCL